MFRALILLLVVGCLLTINSAQANPAGPGAPRSAQAGLDASLVQEIDRLISSRFSSDAPGIAVGIVQNNELVYARGRGLANLEWNTSISPRTVFGIASISKQFTAAAFLLLEQDNIVSLDDDIRLWIPEFPEYGSPVTARHLLAHTSGVRDYEDLRQLGGHPSVNYSNSSGELDRICEQNHLNFSPGSQYQYTNSGYLLLGVIVERASGLSLREFCDQRVFAPLGMSETFFWDDWQDVVAQRATAYKMSGEQYRTLHFPNDETVGAGGVHTSIQDLALWEGAVQTGALGGRQLTESLHTRGHSTTGRHSTMRPGLNLVNTEVSRPPATVAPTLAFARSCCASCRKAHR